MAAKVVGKTKRSKAFFEGNVRAFGEMPGGPSEAQREVRGWQFTKSDYVGRSISRKQFSIEDKVPFHMPDVKLLAWSPASKDSGERGCDLRGRVRDPESLTMTAALYFSFIR